MLSVANLRINSIVTLLYLLLSGKAKMLSSSGAQIIQNHVSIVIRLQEQMKCSLCDHYPSAAAHFTARLLSPLWNIPYGTLDDGARSHRDLGPTSRRINFHIPN